MTETNAELVQLRGRSQLTLPGFVRKTLGLDEGDLFEVSIRDGEIVLRPKRVIDVSQAWFWSQRWQDGEKQAEQDVSNGATHAFGDAAAAVDFLRARAEKAMRRKAG
jgi:AbrB family looped-hinge helix DNA binding protein